MNRTLDEILQDILALEGRRDREAAHARADELLLEALILLGREDIANAFEDVRTKIGFWYA